MKEITIISGKGGTGKTTIVGSLASLAEGAVFADCDVDAANLGLIMKPDTRESHEFRASSQAFIDSEKCALCGRCQDLCRFDAILDSSDGGYKVDGLSCEGCGVCFHACPADAIEMREVVSGQWFISDTPYGTLVHARLGIGEDNSGRLVTQVRQKARELASEADNVEVIITDGPPGIGCPVISSLTGTSMALIVTEPSRSALHDMGRVVELCQHFNVEVKVIINKHDLHSGGTTAVEDYCRDQGIEIIGRVPFDKDVVKSMVEGRPVVDYSDGPASQEIREVWRRIREMGAG